LCDCVAGRREGSGDGFCRAGRFGLHALTCGGPATARYPGLATTPFNLRLLRGRSASWAGRAPRAAVSRLLGVGLPQEVCASRISLWTGGLQDDRGVGLSNFLRPGTDRGAFTFPRSRRPAARLGPARSAKSRSPTRHECRRPLANARRSLIPCRAPKGPRDRRARFRARRRRRTSYGASTSNVTSCAPCQRT
jgi:hypothetical protein